MLYTEVIPNREDEARRLFVPIAISSATAAVMAPRPSEVVDEAPNDMATTVHDVADAELVSNVEVVPFETKTIIAVIPARNEETTIVACIASLLDQERPPDGVVVVINNSTDRTEKVAVEAFRATLGSRSW